MVSNTKWRQLCTSIYIYICSYNWHKLSIALTVIRLKVNMIDVRALKVRMIVRTWRSRWSMWGPSTWTWSSRWSLWGPEGQDDQYMVLEGQNDQCEGLGNFVPPNFDQQDQQGGGGERNSHLPPTHHSCFSQTISLTFLKTFITSLWTFLIFYITFRPWKDMNFDKSYPVLFKVHYSKP